jgi:hypothetical protein
MLVTTFDKKRDISDRYASCLSIQGFKVIILRATKVEDRFMRF